MKRWLVSSIALFLLSTPIWADQTPDEAIGHSLDMVEHQPITEFPKKKLMNDVDGCLEYRIYVPVYQPHLNTTETVRAIYSLPKQQKPMPAVLIVPTIEGDTMVEHKIQDQMCKRKIASIYPEFPMNNIKAEKATLSSFDENTQLTMRRLRTLLDVFGLETQYPIDTTRMGIYGNSLGGVMSSMLSLFDSRVKICVMGAAGLHFNSILAYSVDGDVVDIRKALMKKYNLATVKDYEDALDKAITLRTEFFKPFFATKPTFMMIATKDEHVPTRYQWDLWNEFGQPEHITINKAHVASIVNFVIFNNPAPLNFIVRELQP